MKSESISNLTLDPFIDLSLCEHGKSCIGKEFVELLGVGLKRWLAGILKDNGVTTDPIILGTVKPGAIIEGPVYIAHGAVVEPTAYIQGPAYIGSHAEVRHGAYIRGQVYLGSNGVVGHTSEIKGSVLFDGAKAAHFAYVGDSILGRNVNLGAGTKLANLPLNRRSITIMHPHSKEIIDTGLHKFGAVLGDDCQTGCNSVLSPGTLLLKNTAVLPCVHFRGTLTEGWFRG